MINDSSNRQDFAGESQGRSMEERATVLELSLDELDYVSGGFVIIRPIKPWYAGN
jgi:hypothetical protein